MSADHSEARERARQEDCAITASGLLRLADAAKKCGVPRYANAYRLVAEKLLELNAQGKLREIEAGRRSLEQERWISVEERLPEDGRLVLISYGQGLVYCGRYDEAIKAWHLPRGTQTPVTHWQPLPAPPVHKGDS